MVIDRLQVTEAQSAAGTAAEGAQCWCRKIWMGIQDQHPDKRSGLSASALSTCEGRTCSSISFGRRSKVYMLFVMHGEKMQGRK